MVCTCFRLPKRAIRIRSAAWIQLSTWESSESWTLHRYITTATPSYSPRTLLAHDRIPRWRIKWTGDASVHISRECTVVGVTFSNVCTDIGYAFCSNRLLLDRAARRHWASPKSYSMSNGCFAHKIVRTSSSRNVARRRSVRWTPVGVSSTIGLSSRSRRGRRANVPIRNTRQR